MDQILSLHFAKILLYLCAGHALCDYPLQGDFLSRGKNRLVPGVPWYQCLASHSIIHSAMVCWATGSFTLGIAELGIHAVTDYSKGRYWISFNTDQGIHWTCKLAWAVLIVFFKDIR